MAQAWRRTAAAGGSDAQATNTADLWGQITSCLVSAGWSVLQTLLGGSDVVYSSPGENGNEVSFLRVNSTISGLWLRHYQYWSVSDSAGRNEIGGFNTSGGNTLEGFTTSTYDYVITADLDTWAIFIRKTDGSRWFQYGGLLKRTPGTNANKMVSVGTYSTGVQTINVAPSDPQALGYRIGDLVVVSSQQFSTPYIPVFCSRITDIGANSITLDVREALTAAGALIGGDPQPQYLSRTDLTFYNPESGAANQIGVSYVIDTVPANLYNGDGGTDGLTLGRAHGLNTGSTYFANLAELDPNNRTGRRGLLRYGAYNTTRGGFRGYVDKVFRYAGTGTLWDIARTSKSTPVRDYVVFLLTNTHVIGPVS